MIHVLLLPARTPKMHGARHVAAIAVKHNPEVQGHKASPRQLLRCGTSMRQRTPLAARDNRFKAHRLRSCTACSIFQFQRNLDLCGTGNHVPKHALKQRTSQRRRPPHALCLVRILDLPQPGDRALQRQKETATAMPFGQGLPHRVQTRKRGLPRIEGAPFCATRHQPLQRK